MDRYALPSSTYHRQASHALPQSASQQPLPVASYPMGSRPQYGPPSSAARDRAPVPFEPSPLDPSRRVVQRPHAPPPPVANNYHAPAAYPVNPTLAAAHRLHYTASQGSLTPPSPARPLSAAPALFPHPPPPTPTPKQTDILELHNEVMRQGRALDWKDEQVPGHMWRSTVLIDNREMGVADGRTKKDARHKAARSALHALSRTQPRMRLYP